MQPFPVKEQRWQITSGGGTSGRWSADGTKLYYLNADRRVTTVKVDTRSGFELGTPEFHGSAGSMDISNPAPDGTIYVSRDRTSIDTVTLLTNWHRTLKR